MDLPKGHKVVLAYIAVAHLDEEYVTTGEAYGYYKEDWRGDGSTPLGERRFMEIINELSMMGLLDAPKFSRGRHGYTKIITLRVNPETVLDILFPKWREKKKECFGLVFLSHAFWCTWLYMISNTGGYLLNLGPSGVKITSHLSISGLPTTRSKSSLRFSTTSSTAPPGIS